MIQKVSNVVKKDMVREAGPRRLGGEAPSQGPAGPRARIVEQKDGLAVVEVTCACGRRTLLHCETAGQGTP